MVNSNHNNTKRIKIIIIIMVKIGNMLDKIKME